MLNKRIDVSKKAKPSGWRFKGSHKDLKSKYYKRPQRELGPRQLENAKESGLVYYEPRLSKGDMRHQDRFEKGGSLYAGGGIIGSLLKSHTLAEMFGM